MTRALLPIQPGREEEAKRPLGVENILAALHGIPTLELSLIIARQEGAVRPIDRGRRLAE